MLSLAAKYTTMLPTVPSANCTTFSWVRRYGGVDTVLMWPSYPLLGIDDRSSYDLVAAMPGGTCAYAGGVCAGSLLSHTPSRTMPDI